MKAIKFDAIKQTFSIEDVEELDLEYLQKSVGGYLETLPSQFLNELGIIAWCNEHGKLNGLEPALYLTNDNEIYDVAVGNILFTGYDAEGETVGLSDAQIKTITTLLETRKIFGDYGLMPSIPFIYKGFE